MLDVIESQFLRVLQFFPWLQSMCAVLHYLVREVLFVDLPKKDIFPFVFLTCDQVVRNTTWSQLIYHWESIRNGWHLYNSTICTTLPFFKSIVFNDRKCWLANVQLLIRFDWVCKINPLLITRYDSLYEAPVKWIFQ